MLTVRRYRAIDAEAVWALHEAAAEPFSMRPPDSYFADLRDIEAAFLASGGEYVVGELDGSIVAMGGFKPTSPGRAEITRMRVHPDFQRRGLGTAILEHLEKRARECGCHSLYLDTAREQRQAQQFYLRNHYRRVGEGMKQGFQVVYFEKQLVPGSPV